MTYAVTELVHLSGHSLLSAVVKRWPEVGPTTKIEIVTAGTHQFDYIKLNIDGVEYRRTARFVEFSDGYRFFYFAYVHEFNLLYYWSK